jgi:hypothetical protein
MSLILGKKSLRDMILKDLLMEDKLQTRNNIYKLRDQKATKKDNNFLKRDHI